MRKKRNVVRIMQGVVNKIFILVLAFSLSGFTCLAAEPANIQPEMDGEVEELEAKIIEDIDFSSEIIPYTMLVHCKISVSGDDEGMHIDIATGAVGVASVLGVKDVKIQKKTWYGGWKTVATSSGGESKDRSTMGITILYGNAEKDATYRILCVHYADVDGYTECDNDSGSFVFTY